MRTPKIILVPGIEATDLVEALMGSGLEVGHTHDTNVFVIKRCPVKPLLRECDPSGGRDFLRPINLALEISE